LPPYNYPTSHPQTTMTVYIIDDEVRSAELLKAKIENVTDYFDTIKTFDSPIIAYRAIKESTPDLIFSDIEMPLMNGIDMLDQIKHLGIPTVYVTAFNIYSIKAIKQQIFDYILKPVKEQELLTTINKFIDWEKAKNSFQPSSFNHSALTNVLIKQNNRLAIHTAESISLVSINLISHVVGEDNYSNFFFHDKSSLLSSKTLKFFETQLVHFGFIRVHKSYLVNMVYVDKIITRDGGQLLLKSGQLIPFVRERKSELLDWFKA
jgi:two-component system LytT family response regulator